MAVLISYHVLGVQLSGSKISLFQGSCVGGRGKKTTTGKTSGESSCTVLWSVHCF